MQPYFFDPDQLARLADERHDDYVNAQPFPHAVFDNFVPEWVIDQVLEEFPNPRAIDWQQFESPQEVKLACADDAQLGEFTRSLLAQFNSSTMIAFLERLTGISGLIPDPHFVGGGLHQIERDGYLKVHADFNRHDRLRLDRRLNLLVYLNKDWEESYGGHLELWDREMQNPVQRVLPIARRCVVFSTTDSSFHGHPDPLTCPPDRYRRSIALYYYSNGRPAEEATPEHTTLFQRRPGEHRAVGKLSRRDRLRRWIPPAIADRLTRSS